MCIRAKMMKGIRFVNLSIVNVFVALVFAITVLYVCQESVWVSMMWIYIANLLIIKEYVPRIPV